MIVMLVIASVLQLSLLNWLGAWALLIMALGIVLIPAVAWWEVRAMNRVLVDE